MNLLVFLLISIIGVHTREIIMAAGVGNYSSEQLQQQYQTYKSYSNIGLITGSSILVYQLTTDGMLAEWETTDPGLTASLYQVKIKKELGLKAYPAIFCDATVGACTNLSDRLAMMIKNKDNFIADSIQQAKRYSWDGYLVDFEPDSPTDAGTLTKLMTEWAAALHPYNLTLGIWFDSNTPYILATLAQSPNINLISMDTYAAAYSSFIMIAGAKQTQIPTPNLSFGLLTYSLGSDINESDIIAISQWLILTKTPSLVLWASTIPPTWYHGLHQFIA